MTLPRRDAAHPNDSGGEQERDQVVVQHLLRWYAVNARVFPWRTGELQPWQVLVAEMLLRQTQAWRVAPFLGELFSAYPTLDALVEVDEEELAKRLRPLGLHYTRAHQIHRVVLALCERGGVIPTRQDELEALPGVGPYVAASFLVAAHAQAVAPVDGNVARVLERIYGPRQFPDLRRDPHVNRTAARLVKLAGDRRLTWAILDLAAAICRARKPECARCPLAAVCPSAGRLDANARIRLSGAAVN